MPIKRRPTAKDPGRRRFTVFGIAGGTRVLASQPRDESEEADEFT
jgi:hypothetical protein